MSFALKRRLLYAGLLLFTLWPVMHMYLVRRFEMSSWKLAGWGMYATPQPKFAVVRVFGRTSGSEFEQITAFPAPLRALGDKFLERHRWLGQLARPGKFAAALMQKFPQFTDLKIVVYAPRLDRRTGMIAIHQVVYDYRATAGLAPR